MTAKGGVPEVIIVDETELNTTHTREILVVGGWFALDPYDKTLLGFAITQGRSILECMLVFLSLFVPLLALYHKPHVVITDGDKWYI